MAKMRVHELAKEIDKNNKDVLDVLQANGVNVHNFRIHTDWTVLFETGNILI